MINDGMAVPLATVAKMTEAKACMVFDMKHRFEQTDVSTPRQVAPVENLFELEIGRRLHALQPQIRGITITGDNEPSY
eukprot:2408573-Amphidinium_carterae.1